MLRPPIGPYTEAEIAYRREQARPRTRAVEETGSGSRTAHTDGAILRWWQQLAFGHLKTASVSRTAPEDGHGNRSRARRLKTAHGW
jgi:hypothetical protein